MGTKKYGLLLTLPVLLTLVVASSCKKDKENFRQKNYALSAVGTSGASGTVTISENSDKSFNIRLNLNKSVKDTVHIVKLFSGSVTAPGALALNLNNITGTGAAVTGETRNIKQIKLPDNSMKNVTYDSILNYNAFITVIHSAFRADSLLAKGNVGKQ